MAGEEEEGEEMGDGGEGEHGTGCDGGESDVGGEEDDGFGKGGGGDKTEESVIEGEAGIVGEGNGEDVRKGREIFGKGRLVNNGDEGGRGDIEGTRKMASLKTT